MAALTHQGRFRVEREEQSAGSPEQQEGSDAFPLPGWILARSLSCQLELPAPKSCAREAVDPVPVLGLGALCSGQVKQWRMSHFKVRGDK